MSNLHTASGRWGHLDGARKGFLRRCEKYASLTVPKVCLPENWSQNSQELLHDNQSVGAQSVNHLANKLMLALFAPSRPFFRLDPSSKMRKEMLAANVSPDTIAGQLSLAEGDAVKAMDRLSIRPKLYDAIKHLIVTGNVLLEFEDEGIRIIGLRNYAVARSKSGTLLEMMIHDRMQYSELAEEVQAACKAQGLSRKPDNEVSRYRWIKRQPNGSYRMTVHIDTIELPKKFQGRWPEARLPFRALTWDLADGFDYGTGLVEDYAGDFAGLSMLSRAQIEGALLASQFRWLVNPGGFTQPEDLERSANGAALPGMKDDVQLVASGKSADLQIVMQMAGEYINRIGRGFLLGSAVTRDAERVTAQEIRMQATELETSLGGAYSRLAVDFQVPMAHWLLAQLDMDIIGSDIEASIVTGLDALSRGGDLDNLQLFLSDVASLGNARPEVLGVLKMHNIFAAFATARRIDAQQFVKSEQELAQEAQAAQEQQLQAQATQSGIEGAQQVAVNQATQG